MSEIRNEYERVTKTKEDIIKEINELMNNETVKKYLELKKEHDSLSEEQSKLYKKMKFEEYSNCHHILVTTDIYKDRQEGRMYCSYGCIKCGLNNNAFNSEIVDRSDLDFENQIMFDYACRHYMGGMKIGVTCDIDLAKAIYSKIKESHPDIDDETAIKYFKNAWVNMVYKYSSPERVESRIKRLSLSPNFGHWIDGGYKKYDPRYKKTINEVRDIMNEK